jgi:hypothetical protein
MGKVIIVSGFGESDWEIVGSNFEIYGKKTQRELYKWFQLNGSNTKDYDEGLGRFEKTTFFWRYFKKKKKKKTNSNFISEWQRKKL